MQHEMEKLDPQHFLTGEYLYNNVRAYVALGEHRTATSTDRKTSEWLQKQVEGFGFKSRVIPFRVRQFFLDSAKLSSTGVEIACFPMWFPGGTSAVRAPMAHQDLKSYIAIARLPNTPPRGYPGSRCDDSTAD